MIAHAFVGFSHVLILLDRLDDAAIFIENLLDVRGTWWRWSGSAREESDALDFNLFAVFKLELSFVTNLPLLLLLHWRLLWWAAILRRRIRYGHFEVA